MTNFGGGVFTDNEPIKRKQEHETLKRHPLKSAPPQTKLTHTLLHFLYKLEVAHLILLPQRLCIIDVWKTDAPWSTHLMIMNLQSIITELEDWRS